MYLAWDKVWLFFSEDRLATLWNSRAHFTQVKLHLLFGWNFKFLQILLFIQSTVANRQFAIYVEYIVLL